MALYNILQLLGWSYILFCTVTVVRAGGGSPGVWQVGSTRCRFRQACLVRPKQRLCTVATCSSTPVHLSQAVQLPLKIFQTAAVLEVGVGDVSACICTLPCALCAVDGVMLWHRFFTASLAL